MSSPASSTAARAQDYLVLTARWLLAGIFLVYGVGKLTGFQFGVSARELAQPLGKVGLDRLAWYLFDQQPFKGFIGWAQVLAALLLLYHRTALLGALLLLPIAATIFIIDLTYLSHIVAFRYMLPFYLGLILLICYHYRDRMVVVWRALTQGLAPRFAYPWWAYALLPLAALALNAVWLLPKCAVDFIYHPAATKHYFAQVVAHLGAWLH